MIVQKMYSKSQHAICAHVTVVCKNCTAQKMYSDDGHAKSAGSMWTRKMCGYGCTLNAHCACRKYCALLCHAMGASVLISFDYGYANSAHTKVKHAKCAQNHDRSMQNVRIGPRGPCRVPVYTYM